MTARAKGAASRAREPAERRDAVINVRVPIKTRDLIDTAAAVAGKTRTEFMVESAAQRATDVLLDQRLFSLGEKEFGAFMAVLDDPPEPNEKLRELFREKAPWKS